LPFHDLDEFLKEEALPIQGKAFVIFDGIDDAA